MTQPLLSIENLSIAFSKQGETRTVVNDLSLQIQRGETLALVGESGSGKSVSALSICVCSLPRRSAIRRVTFCSIAVRCCMRMSKPCVGSAAIRLP